MLGLERVSKTLGDFEMTDVSFEVGDGEYFVLLGASGVGKTVLLETIAGLMVPDSGKISLDGRDITTERIQRRGTALVYQDRALFPHMSVADNIAYGLRCRGLGRGDIAARVRHLADEVDAGGLLDRSPGTLSGGEAQRVALARALGTEPKCLLLDEPLSALDSKARGRMRSLLRKLNRLGHTMLHVTHDYEEAVSLASRVAIMEDGGVAQVGAPDEVFRHPRSEFVARFVGVRNFFKGELRTPRAGDLAEFVTAGPVFHILTDAAPQEGFLMVRSEDITLSNEPVETSARNTFEGTVVDIAPARLGVEVTVDIGLEIVAAVTPGSVERLALEVDRKVRVSFKATAARFIEE